MEGENKYRDLVKTIDEDEDVEDYSEESDAEVEVGVRLSEIFSAQTTRISSSFNPLNKKTNEKPNSTQTSNSSAP